MNYLRYLFLPISVVYGGITLLRNGLYNKKIFKSSSFDMPIICVGNLSMGGTGKTPHTEYLIRLLKDEFKVATLSRGYGRKTNDFILAEDGVDASIIGDEPMQYFRKFEDIHVAVEKKRVLGVLFILNSAEDTDVVILDDAFQHRALNAGFNILLTDYNQPFFEDKILPVGDLREFRAGAKRADIVVVTKCPDNLVQQQKEKFWQNIPVDKENVFFSRINYRGIYNGLDNKPLEGDIAEYDVLLVTGIANPKPIEEYLSARKVNFSSIDFGDHHRFKKKDVELVSKKLVTFTNSKKIVLTTEKDFARMLLLKEFQALPIFCLEIQIELLENKDKFEQKVLEYVRSNQRDRSVSEGEDTV